MAGIVNYLTLALLIYAIFFAIKYWADVKPNISLIFPHWIAVFILAVASAAAATLVGVTREDNLSTMTDTLYQVTRNSFMGAVGLSLFAAGGTTIVVRTWENTLRFWKEVPKSHTIGLVLLITVYTFTLFKLFPGRLTYLRGGETFGILLTLYIYTMLTAISEEMLVRLSVLGFLTRLFKQSRFNWEIGIAVSAAFWAAMHVLVIQNDMIKFVHIFPIGIALGYLLKRYGFEACVFVHASVNILNVTIMLLT
jgi:hypothetical protein